MPSRTVRPRRLGSRLWSAVAFKLLVQEVVVLTRVLAAEVNYGYQDQGRHVMKLSMWQDLSCCQLLSFQGKPVQSLSDLRERLRDSREAFLRFNLSLLGLLPMP